MIPATRRPYYLPTVLLGLSTTALLSILLGAAISHFPFEVLGIVLFSGLLWLAYAQPVVAFVLIVATMAFPYTWTPSVGGHFLTPSTIGGVVFVLTGLMRGRWFRLNAVDWIVVAYVLTSVLSLIANSSDGLAFLQPNFENILMPYVGWRMLLAHDRSVRKTVIPCLLAVGTGVAVVGIVEFLHGSGLFIHAFVDPRLSAWAHTYLRSGQVRIAGPFGQPLALGMFLLIPLGFATTLTGRRRLAVLSLLLSAEILTLSRGPWLGVIVLSLLLLPMLAKRLKRTSLIGVFVLLLICLAVFSGPVGNVLSQTTQQGTEINSNGIYRANLLQTSVAQAHLLGNPVNTGSEGSLEEAGFKDVASWYAQTLAGQGWVGIACLFALVGVAMTALSRGYRYNLLMLTILAAITLAQLVALVTAPPITNYRAFLWLTIACLATWFVDKRGEMRGIFKPRLEHHL
jgi:hypothetical protein